MDIYVRKCYNIDYNIRYTEEPIKQKFNGFIIIFQVLFLEIPILLS